MSGGGAQLASVPQARLAATQIAMRVHQCARMRPPSSRLTRSALLLHAGGRGGRQELAQAVAEWRVRRERGGRRGTAGGCDGARRQLRQVCGAAPWLLRWRTGRTLRVIAAAPPNAALARLLAGATH
jgi:hypothetical protein